MARVAGASLVAAAATLVVVTLVTAWARAPVWVLPAVAAAFLVVVAGLVVHLGRTPVVTLTDLGYTVRLARGVGTSAGRWVEVHEATATTVAGHRCLEIRLTDGSTTTIPVEVLAVEPDTFAQDVLLHLRRARGRSATPLRESD